MTLRKFEARYFTGVHGFVMFSTYIDPIVGRLLSKGRHDPRGKEN